jgi:predicted nucleic acid-binding protein
MGLLVDAGAMYAQADRDDPDHDAVTSLLRAERSPLVTSQVAAAEADSLILTRLGVDVELAFWSELATGPSRPRA